VANHNDRLGKYDLATIEEVERRLASEVEIGIGDECSGDFAWSAYNSDDVDRIIRDMKADTPGHVHSGTKDGFYFGVQHYQCNSCGRDFTDIE
jgi:hypothetical protein